MVSKNAYLLGKSQPEKELGEEKLSVRGAKVGKLTSEQEVLPGASAKNG